MRDYNLEITDNERQYGYNFDYDIIHRYMIKSFKEHFQPGSILELGCYQGAFTSRLAEIFSDITCIEASSDALSVAKQIKNLSNATFINATFENITLDKKFDNIIMTHVLEHIDARVELLQKIRKFWLKDNGIFIVACPNAYAPSRQIAVHMGIVEHPEVVTKSEHQHGHRITYSMATLKKDIEESGLKIKYNSGIFFKAMANFQWDKLLKTDIISEEYLDGCYELGKKYPDLSSTIFFVCQT